MSDIERSTLPWIHRPWVQQRIWLPLLALILGIAAVTYAAEQAVGAKARERERAEVLGRLSTIRARLEGTISSNLLLARGLVAEIAHNPEITQERFAQLAQVLLRDKPHVRNIGAARDLVITHIYPFAGNEKAIGLDYRIHPTQRQAALRARDEGRLVVAGPLPLVQGGSGLIGRAPVFLVSTDGERGRFWGLVSTVLDLDSIYLSSGLGGADLGLEVALRRSAQEPGAQGETFFGDPALFAQHPVTVHVAVPSGYWQFAGIPAAGWTATPAGVWLVRSAGIVLMLFCGLFVLSREAARLEQRRASEELREVRGRLADAIESISDGFALWDADDRLVLCNAHYRRLYPEIGQELVPGASFGEMVRLAAERGVFEVEGDLEGWIRRRLEVHRPPREDHEVRLRDGRVIRMREYLTSDNAVVGIHADVTELRQAEADVRYRAYYDVLTGLPNRAHFLERLEGAIGRSRRTGKPLALLFVDLDRFKNINDTLGHHLGDRMLKISAERIREAVRESDTVARLGGDEFTVIAESLEDSLGATLIAESVLGRLGEPYDLEGNRLHCGASIGITMFPSDARDANTLLKNADMAMYQAKEQGRETFRFFTREMTHLAQAFVAMESSLRRAVEEHQFVLHYQPLYHLSSGRMVGAEALVRWLHPERGLVMPGEFIPTAEESGLIVDIGRQVLDRACLEAAGWPALAAAAGVAAPSLSVNVSSRQFRAGFGPEQVEAALSGSGLAAERLTLEITESLLMEERGAVRSVLRQLRDRGVGLVLDDFGTGYSSLSYLRRFPVSGLKIDRSFVRDMDSDASDARLVESIVAMAKGLGITPVAEGIETVGQAAALQRMGCPLGQGYLLSRPIDAAAFRELLSQGCPSTPFWAEEAPAPLSRASGD